MLKCPVCDQKQDFLLTEEVERFKIWECSSCGLNFSDPLYYDRHFYAEWYMKNGDPYHYSDQFQVTKLLRKQPEKVYSFLSSNQSFALRQINKRFKKGRKILDIGCGSGSFLFALKQCGYIPFGVDIVSPVIEELRLAGFNVVQGSAEDVPKGWGDFEVITLFEVLEHLPDPIKFLDGIKSRWPNASLILSVPDPKRINLLFQEREKADYPPHHLTRWTPKALKILLSRAGYKEFKIKRFRPRGSSIVPHTGIVAFFRGRKERSATEAVSIRADFMFHTIPILIKDYIFSPVTIVFWLLGWHDFFMIALAR